MHAYVVHYSTFLCSLKNRKWFEFFFPVHCLVPYLTVLLHFLNLNCFTIVKIAATSFNIGSCS